MLTAVLFIFFIIIFSLYQLYQSCSGRLFYSENYVIILPSNPKIMSKFCITVNLLKAPSYTDLLTMKHLSLGNTWNTVIILSLKVIKISIFVILTKVAEL